MKFLKRSLYVAAALSLMTACSTDDVDPNGGDVPGVGKDGVYITLTLNPSGARSETSGDNASSDGVEVGSDEENAIKTALVILTKRDNKFIAAGAITANSGSITAGTVAGTTLYQATAEISKTKLNDYYSAGGNGKVNVYVFCNPSNALITQFDRIELDDETWMNLVCDNVENMWNAANGFYMTNVTTAQRDLPANIAAWGNYNTALKAFDLSGINAPGTADAVDNLTDRGSVRVHRMAARFDFRDGSQWLVEGEPIGNGVKGQPFTYGVVHNVKGETIVNAKILAMALNNMSKTQYYFGRVSDTGRMTNTAGVVAAGYAFCGPEKAWFNGAGGNYVISTYAQEKYQHITTNFANYFHYPFFDENGVVSEKGAGWDWVYVDNVVKNPSDNYGGKNYHVWRYVSENTIPAQPNNQINSQTTGVAFKVRLLATDKLTDEGSDKYELMLAECLDYKSSSVGTGKLLHNNADLDPTIFSLSGNSLYASWENVFFAALAEAGYDETKGQNQELDRNAPLYRTVFGDGGVGTVKNDAGTTVYTDDLAENTTSPNYLWNVWNNARKPGSGSSATATEAAKLAFKKAATGVGFTLYQSSQDPVTNEWGYYCYYYYWNRHNDNGQDGVMGPMEFAVVRNNVYKLAVTTLHSLGHPRIPENDPDDPKPEDPDEKSEVYLTVSVDVVPWVVRVNNIIF